MSSALAGKVALITGASSGIGLTVAKRLAREGVLVMLADRDIAAGEQASAEITACGGAAAFVCCDVTIPEEVEQMVRSTTNHFGRLDIAFNNAGVGGKKGVPTDALTVDDWDRIIAVNLTSVFLCMKYELGYMVDQGSGAIINTSSTAGLGAAVNSGVAYAASKHGVIGLTKTAAKEYLTKGVRVNAICPAGVATPLLQRTIGDEAFEKASSANLIATPDDIASAVVWLASPASAYVNGHALLLDGGRVL